MTRLPAGNIRFRLSRTPGAGLRIPAGPTAPARGLFLISVEY